jgi:hypothetical protein
MSNVIPFPSRPDPIPAPDLFFPETQAALDVLRERFRILEGGGAPPVGASEREEKLYAAACVILWIEKCDRDGWDGAKSDG